MSDHVDAVEEGNQAALDAAVGLITDDILDIIEDKPQDLPPPGEKPGQIIDGENQSVSTPQVVPPVVPAASSTPTPEPKEKIKWQGQEMELSKDELVNLAQMGFDYTKKTQELSARSAELAPLEGLAKHIKEDPRFAAHIATYWKKEEPKEEKPPEDPIERVKWEAKNEARKEILAEVEEKYVRPMQAHVEQTAHVTELNRVKSHVQADPEFAKIHGEIVNYVKSLPPAIGKTVYLQLDQDPQAYLETFNQFKSRLTTPPKTDAPLPPPTKKEERAPILETPGKTPETPPSVEAERATLSRQKKDALRSGNIDVISKWLTGSGALDHLFKE